MMDLEEAPSVKGIPGENDGLLSLKSVCTNDRRACRSCQEEIGLKLRFLKHGGNWRQTGK